MRGGLWRGRDDGEGALARMLVLLLCLGLCTELAVPFGLELVGDALEDGERSGWAEDVSLEGIMRDARGQRAG